MVPGPAQAAPLGVTAPAECATSHTMAWLRLVASLLWGASALAQVPAGPAFEAGDPAALTCRVVAQKPAEDGRLLLTVEVNNRSSLAAEPLVFELEQPQGKGQPPQVETFARAQLPHVARYGRPAPAGGKQTYLVPVGPAKKGTWSARVTAASFGRDLAVAEPAFRFGKPEQVQRTSLAGTFPVTQVAIGNPLPCDVDVLMHVTYQQPKDCVELVGVRLPAGATLAVVIATRPGREVFLDPLGPREVVWDRSLNFLSPAARSIRWRRCASWRR